MSEKEQKAREVKDKVISDFKKVNEMIRAVNKEVVHPDEVLSDKAYIYNCATNELRITNG